MRTIRHALIMAAGRGQRMMPLTQDVPKAMAPYLNSTLIAHGLGRIRKHVANVHVTVGYKGAMLSHHLIEEGVASIINTNGHSNSWWIYNSLLSQLDEPVFVLTCDNITELDFYRLTQEYHRHGEPACMIVPVRPIPGLDGDYIFHKDGFVIALSRTDVTDIYCSGIQIVNPAEVVRRTHDGGDFYSVWEQLIAQQQLRLSDVYPDEWFSVDTVKDLEVLRGAVSRSVPTR